MTENYRSVFDIIGPIMIGPSSSHTAGAVAIGRVARQVLGQTPVRVTVHYYESFAQTHQGHGTDYAIVAGLLQMDPADPRVPNSRELASQAGIEINFVEEPGASPIGHPNTAVLDLVGATKQTRLSGCSVGGGIIEVRELVLEGVAIQPSGPLPIVLFQAPVADQAKQEQGRLLINDLEWKAPLSSNRSLPARTARFGPLTSRTTCKTTCGPIYYKPTRASFV
ncbi:serine dehydratase beta chain [Limosilactobacillus fermentum]|nr:serine dehydratase beta chain [Limosilactobacillus fermentum]